MLFLPVVSGLFGFVVWYHSGISWLPFGWANLAMNISVLEGLNQSEDLVNVSADWKVVD